MHWNSQQGILLHESRLYSAVQLHSSCSVKRKALHLITSRTLEMRSWRLCPPFSKELFYIMKLKAIGRDFFILWAMGTAVKTHLAWMGNNLPKLETTWDIGFGLKRHSLSWYRYADKARWRFVPSHTEFVKRKSVFVWYPAHGVCSLGLRSYTCYKTTDYQH